LAPLPPAENNTFSLTILGDFYKPLRLTKPSNSRDGNLALGTGGR